jgi:hypothetical protein
MQDDLTKAIATDLGIADLSPEQQTELIGQFGEVALKAATLAIVEKLTSEKRDEFVKLTQAGDAAAMQTFLDREVPTYEELTKNAVAEEIKRFKDFQAA